MKRLFALVMMIQMCGLLSLLFTARLTSPPVIPPTVYPTSTPTVNPRTLITVEPTRANVGDAITVRVTVVQIGIPHYTLTSDGGLNVRVTYSNELIDAPEINANDGVLALISADGGMSEATFTLRAVGAGVVWLNVYASGEIHAGYPGPAYWGGASSESIEVIIH